SPVFLALQRVSNLLWTVGEAFPWGPSTLLRFVDDPNVDKVETLTPVNGIAYTIQFHPDFVNNGYVFIGRNTPAGDPARKSQIVRYHVDPNPPYKLDLQSE